MGRMVATSSATEQETAVTQSIRIRSGGALSVAALDDDNMVICGGNRSIGSPGVVGHGKHGGQL